MAARSTEEAGSKIDELISRWMAAEQRLYPLALSDPEAYERSLILVRSIADALRASDTSERLREAWEDRAVIVERAMGGSEIAGCGLDVELVTSAAFGLRHREMLAETARHEVDQRIREANEHGSSWAVVRETVSAFGPSMPPFHRWELHLPTGAVLHASVELGPEMDRPVFQIEVVPPQATPGEPSAGRRGSQRYDFDDRAAWERALEDLRARLESSA